MKIALFGYGRMGKAIEKIAIERGHEIVLKIDVNDKVYNLKKADVAIDFSSPTAAYNNLKTCIDQNVPVICGTTGWLDKYDHIVEYCKEKKGALIYASNFSVGVNLFFNLTEYLAKIMQNIEGYDVGMKEIHHIHKLDAPSGTAITLAEQVLKSKKQWSIDVQSADNLFIEVEREGEVPGTHAVTYQSEVDQIEIKHTAHNRQGFAKGAVIASEWICGKTGVFSMQDVLNG